MTNGTRNTWRLAVLALAVGSGQLAAVRGVGTQAEALLADEPGRAVVMAGAILARNLSGIAVEQAQRAAGAFLLGAAKGTARLQSLALQVIETAGHGSFQAVRPTVATEVNLNPVACEIAKKECAMVAAGRHAVVVSRVRPVVVRRVRTEVANPVRPVAVSRVRT